MTKIFTFLVGQSCRSLVSSYLVWDLIKTLVFQAFLRGQVVTDIRFNAKKSPKNQKMRRGPGTS